MNICGRCGQTYKQGRVDARINELRDLIDTFQLEAGDFPTDQNLEVMVEERSILTKARWKQMVAEYGHPMSTRWPKKPLP